MACVPGGNVIANVSDSPRPFAFSTNGLIASESPATFPLNLFRKTDRLPVAIEKPGNDHRLLRRTSRPIVLAIGIPMSMWVP